MTDKIKVTNPFSGQSEMLTLEEYKLYNKIKTLTETEYLECLNRATNGGVVKEVLQ